VKRQDINKNPGLLPGVLFTGLAVKNLYLFDFRFNSRAIIFAASLLNI